MGQRLRTEQSSNEKKKKRKVPQSLLLKCEWVDCNFEDSKEMDFVTHVEHHLPHCEEREEEGESETKVTWFCCMWESCDFDSRNILLTRFHINYHAYHTRVKAQGFLCCESYPDLECYQPYTGRNLLPSVLPVERICEWDDCEYKTDSFSRFIYHVFVGHLAKRGKWRKQTPCKWKDCNKVFISKSLLQKHLRVHTQEKVAACPTCGAQFASNTRLHDHLARQIAPSNKRFQCSYCKKFYPSERVLREHIRLHINPHKCPFCEMTSPFNFTLALHIRYRHLNEKPFKCNFCDHRSITEHDLEKHLETHCSESMWVCESEDCEYSCRDKYALKMHYAKEHNDDEDCNVYVCHVCDKRYPRGTYLTRHLRSKHNYRCASGQTRFRYLRDSCGLFRLQTVRYEAADVEHAPRINESNRKRAPKRFTCVSLAKNKLIITEDISTEERPVCDSDEEDCDDPEIARDMVELSNENSNDSADFETEMEVHADEEMTSDMDIDEARGTEPTLASPTVDHINEEYANSLKKHLGIEGGFIEVVESTS